MATVAESSNRLFWLIVLSIFFPFIAVGLEFGFSKPLAIDFSLGFVIPIIAMVIGGPEKTITIIVGQLFSLSAVVYAIRLLVLRRYENEQVEEEMPLPPVYTPSNAEEAQPQTASKQ